MSIRFSIQTAPDAAPGDEISIDAHHIASDGTWFDHPIRTHKLRAGHTLSLLAHVALGFVLHKGGREELALCITHDEPNATHGLELIESAAPDEHPDVLPGALTLEEVAGDFEAVEMERLVVPPGGDASVTLLRATHLRIREVSMREAAGDA